MYAKVYSKFYSKIHTFFRESYLEDKDNKIHKTHRSYEAPLESDIKTQTKHHLCLSLQISAHLKSGQFLKKSEKKIKLYLTTCLINRESFLFCQASTRRIHSYTFIIRTWTVQKMDLRFSQNLIRTPSGDFKQVSGNLFRVLVTWWCLVSF